MHIARWPMGKVKPYARNPRVHGRAIDAVAASIKEFGFRQPIVVDAKGVIIVGHARYQAAEKLGLKFVHVHVAKDLTPDQVRAYRLADNKTGELSEWDVELLGLELGELKAADYDLASLGFDAHELARLLSPAGELTDPDDVPAPPAKAKTRPGEVILLGEHRLLCGDGSRAADVERLLAGERVQLVNTDPPYNVKVEPRSNNAIAAGLSSFKPTHHQGLDVARHPKKAKATTKELRAKDRPLANDFMSEADFEKLLAAWFGNLAAALEPGRGFYIWGGFSNLGNYPPALKAAGLYFSQTIIWAKNQPVLTRKDFMTSHETCFYGWREGAGHKFFGPKNVPDFWELLLAKDGAYQLGAGLRLQSALGKIDVVPPSGDRPRTIDVEQGVTICGPDCLDVWFVRKVPSQKMVHLTEKPVELARRAMEYSSQPGEIVLDMFGGSGSTLIAAQMTGRRARLIELDPLYCDVIVRRWEAFTGLKAQRIAAGGAIPKPDKPKRKAS